MDLIGRGGEPVAARRRDILDEGMDWDALFVGQPADPGGDQARLRWRAAGRIDDQRHGERLAAPEGGLDQRCEGRITERRAPDAPGRGADGAFEAQDGNCGLPPEEVEGVLHGADVGRRSGVSKATCASDRS